MPIYLHLRKWRFGHASHTGCFSVRRVYLEAISGSDLLHPALLQAMVRQGAEAWEAATFFCEALMQTKGWQSTSGSCVLCTSRPCRRRHPRHQGS